MPWLRALLARRIYPWVAAAFPLLADGTDLGVDGSRLRVHDAFIVRYDSSEAVGSVSLPEHSDTSAVSVTIALYAPDWVPVDEVRVVVNGSSTPIPVPLSSFTASTADFRLRTATVTVPMPVGKDAWLVVEAGVARSTTGVYRAGSPWNKIMKGLYPIAVSNPIFVDVTGGGYTPPGL